MRFFFDIAASAVFIGMILLATMALVRLVDRWLAALSAAF